MGSAGSRYSLGSSGSRYSLGSAGSRISLEVLGADVLWEVFNHHRRFLLITKGHFASLSVGGLGAPRAGGSKISWAVGRGIGSRAGIVPARDREQREAGVSPGDIPGHSPVLWGGSAVPFGDPAGHPGTRILPGGNSLPVLAFQELSLQCGSKHLHSASPACSSCWKCLISFQTPGP